MDGNSKGSGTRTPYTSPLRLHYDDNKGLGYGVLEPTGFNAPRKAQGNFPYLEPDLYANNDLDFDDVLNDRELDIFVTKINQGYLASDFLAAYDPFYFVAGNTPLNVHENVALAESTDSVPPPYRGRKRGPRFRSGVAFPYQGGGGTSYKRTGTVQGYAHAPPPLAVDPTLGQYVVNDLRDMPDKDERTLLKLRVLINDIIHQQENPDDWDN